MMNKKILALLISLVLVLGVVIPGTLAVSADEDAATSELTLAVEPEAPVETETPVETEAPVETDAAVETETPIETEIPVEGEAPAASEAFDALMACETLDALWARMDAMTDDEWAALTEAQLAELDAKLTALEPEPLPAIVIEESEPPVPSEIGYEMVSFTEVAPLGEPVTGGN